MGFGETGHETVEEVAQTLDFRLIGERRSGDQVLGDQSGFVVMGLTQQVPVDALQNAGGPVDHLGPSRARQVQVVLAVDDEVLRQHGDLAHAQHAVRKVEILGVFEFFAQVRAKLPHRLGAEHHRNMPDRIADVQHPPQHAGIGVGGLPAALDFTALQHRHLGAHDQRAGMLVEERLLLLETGRPAEIVRVDARDIPAAGLLHRPVEGTDNPEVARIVQNRSRGSAIPERISRVRSVEPSFTTRSSKSSNV